MGFNGGQALVAILTLTIGGLALRHLRKSKRGDSESTSRTDDASGEENEALRRDSESTLRTDDASREENKALRRDSVSTSRTDDPTTSRMDDVSRKEKEALRRDSESTSRTDVSIISRTDDSVGEENRALRRDLESASTSTRAVSALGGLAVRQLTKSKKRKYSESNSISDDASAEENEAFDSSGIEYKGCDTTDQMKRESNSEAIPSMETKPAYQYDVFLSFCGRDTRLTFTDHLYYRMRDAGISVFLDSKDLKYGKRIKEVLKAVDESQIYIPIFSRNFASRPWCLREVERMVEHHSELDEKREIIPIFYDVNADDVKLRTDLYKNDILNFKEYCESEELDRWRKALKEVGRMYGHELIGKSHGTAIESIVKQVLQKLNGKHMDMPKHLVEDYGQIKAIIEKLDVNSGGVRFVGIHGTGGIGKTTLVKVVFKKLSSHFECVSFLNDVRQHDLINLQKNLLSSVGSSQADQIKGIGDGMHRIKGVCQYKKVLIVLDDLDKKEQLEKLAGKYDWFGSGSRIIFTTRNIKVLTTQVGLSSAEVPNQPKRILPHEVQRMEFNRALQLFCKHAFRRDSPIEGYDSLAETIVRRVDMLPLAIEVIGSSLYCSDFVLEQHFDKRQLWEDMLKRLPEGPLKDVRDVLMISYEGLDNKHKEVFLDIACFFTNEDKGYPVIMWDACNYHTCNAIGVLSYGPCLKLEIISLGCMTKFEIWEDILFLKNILENLVGCGLLGMSWNYWRGNREMKM